MILQGFYFQSRIFYLFYGNRRMSMRNMIDNELHISSCAEDF
jgi:hypothetical protein